METKQIKEEINRMKKERKAIILAHLYQVDEIQEIADFTGDSLELSRKTALTDAETIVFCGVKFMAETAKILSPEKMVLLPALDAGCPMADMIARDDVLKLKKNNPGAAVVCYVNSSAEVKAVSDYCCTSANAVNLVRSIPEQEIIFIPDKNLGQYIARKVPEKNFIFWEGFCVTHHRIRGKDLTAARKLHPGVPVLVHPECQPEITKGADFTGSTGQILKHVRESDSDEFIIGTEMGILYRLTTENPEKSFVLLSTGLICPNMKKTRLYDVYMALLEKKHQVHIADDIRRKALVALNRMLELS